MKIILVRHLESNKNLKLQFASKNNQEQLTAPGRRLGKSLAKSIAEYASKNSLISANIYCANSSRAMETAEIIANEMNLSIAPHDDLNSIRYNAFSGLSEGDVETIDPEFIYQLRLYRLGLLSSYDIKYIEGNERVFDFEQRVIKSLLKILGNPELENLKVIVLHRSSILATLFYFLRSYCNYPKDFYGYTQIDVGNVCKLELKNGILFLGLVNEPAEFLNR